MGVLLLIISVALFTHSGALIERSKGVKITKINMLITSSLEFVFAVYFLIAAIGRLHT